MTGTEMTVGEASDCLLDGILIRTIPISGTSEGISLQGSISLVCIADATPIAIGLADASDSQAVSEVEHVIGTVALADDASATDDTPAASASADVAAMTEPTEEASSDAAVPATNAATDTAATATGGTLVQLPSWDVTVSTDPATFVYTSITADYWDDEYAGKAVIGIPVTLTNTGDEFESPWWDITLTRFNPNGVAASDNPDWLFDDSFNNVTDMRPGATANAYVYFFDEGDGTYALGIESWDEDYNTVGEEIELQVAQ